MSGISMSGVGASFATFVANTTQAASSIATTNAGDSVKLPGGEVAARGIDNGSLAAANGARIQQLLDLIDGFSSAEILMALLLTVASQKKEDDNEKGGALALLTGMALANQLRPSGPTHWGGLQGVSDMSSVGLQLNLLG